MPGAERTVGRYEVVREIGRGGMAVVWLARQPDLDRDVALKELASFHAVEAGFAERFAREARVGGALAHPNIVTVFEAFEHGDVPYIAMEYLERGSLRPVVGRLSVAQVAGVLEGLLAGLDHAAAHGVVHRDLKPENVLITGEGRIKIADFGIAKAYNRVWTAQYRTATGMALGTPTYMAPEQAMGREVTARTDLYAVGVMAYELLAGRPPFHDIDEPMAILLRHVSEPVPPLSDAVPAIDPRLAGWVERMLAKDPAERPAGAQAAWEELEEVVVGLLGPLWRRDARLVAPSGAGESRPLTPAPFEDSAGYRTFGAAPAADMPPTTDAAEPPPAATPPSAAATPPPAAEPPPPAAAIPPPADVTARQARENPPTAAATPSPSAAAGPPGAATAPPLAATPPSSAATPPSSAATPPTTAAGASPAPRRRRRRRLVAAGAGLAVVAAAVGVAAVSGAFGGGGSPAPAAVRGLPPCFTKMVAGAIELPKGVEVPVTGSRQAPGKTFTFLLESGPPIGAFAVGVHGGRALFYNALGMHDTRCGAVRPVIVGKPGDYPNFVDYDHVRATLAGRPYDVRLANESGKFTALLSVPAKPPMRMTATRTARGISVDGTVAPDAYGDVTLSYRAPRPGGTVYERSATVTLDHGAFTGSAQVPRHLAAGTLTAVFPGDANYLRASVRSKVPAA